MKIQKFIILFALLILSFNFAFAQKNAPLSERLADTLMNRIWLEDDGTPVGIPQKWTYEQGVQLKAVEQVWYATGNPKYFNFIKRGMDFWYDENGKLNGYDLDEYNIDHITPGRGMLTLYRVTNDEKYKKAAELIRSQLKTHPRTKEGGFWHKKIYPWQMWLDGLYMGTAILCGIFDGLERRQLERHRQSICLDGKTRARPENRIALSRLGRIKRAKMGE